MYFFVNTSKTVYNYQTNMNIYFSASLLGREKHQEEYRRIISILEKKGHIVMADHFFKRNIHNVNKQGISQHRDDYKNMLNSIRNADAVIIEATIGSTGLGHTIGISLQNKKPVLALFQKPSPPHGLLLGDPDRLLTIRQYELKKESDLAKKLDSYINQVSKKLLRIRFNMMLDQNQDEFLAHISNIKNISKSDYIRKLIEQEIRKEHDKKNGNNHL
jgi:hypothetical protein